MNQPLVQVAEEIGVVPAPPTEGKGLGRGRPKLPPVPPRRSRPSVVDTLEEALTKPHDEPLVKGALEIGHNQGALHQLLLDHLAARHGARLCTR